MMVGISRFLVAFPGLWHLKFFSKFYNANMFLSNPIFFSIKTWKKTRRPRGSLTIPHSNRTYFFKDFIDNSWRCSCTSTDWIEISVTMTIWYKKKGGIFSYSRKYNLKIWYFFGKYDRTTFLSERGNVFYVVQTIHDKHIYNVLWHRFEFRR